MALVSDQKIKQRYSSARKSRDARFDGIFFTAVKSTGIFCRSICPARPPLEENVEYHTTAFSAAQSGFRPCLRCRPDSAPRSFAWLGSETTFQRALGLIEQGALQYHSVDSLAARVCISSRYLRELFEKHLGTSPKKYALYQQCLIAKQLLHSSDFLVSDIAFATGFNSVRRFNDAFKQQLHLTPSDVRKRAKSISNCLTLRLNYRPPFAWPELFAFLERRLIDGIEWVDTSAKRQVYFRTIEVESTRGYFSAEHLAASKQVEFKIELNEYKHVQIVLQGLRALFDLDAPISIIDDHLSAAVGEFIQYQPGLRIPGIWGTFEAGVRAILGQQVSVAAAQNLVTRFVEHLGEPLDLDFAADETKSKRLFPLPNAVVGHSLDFFRMPQSRKDTIRRLAQHFIESENPEDIDEWLNIKGIGPWTVNYVKLRSAKDPDIWLAGDAGLKNAIKLLGREPDLTKTEPWRSYLTFQMWNQL